MCNESGESEDKFYENFLTTWKLPKVRFGSFELLIRSSAQRIRRSHSKITFGPLIGPNCAFHTSYSVHKTTGMLILKHLKQSNGNQNVMAKKCRPINIPIHGTCWRL